MNIEVLLILFISTCVNGDYTTNDESSDRDPINQFQNDGVGQNQDIFFDRRIKYTNEGYNAFLDYKTNRNRIRNGSLEIEIQEDIYRPCEINELLCIRKFFAANSNCTPAYSRVPDTVYFRRNNEHPFDNNSVLTDLSVQGLADSRVSDFYVNRSTGNVVIVIEFKNLNISSPNTDVVFSRRRKDSNDFTDYSTEFYSSGNFTVMIPKIPRLHLDLASVQAFLNNTSLDLTVIPKANPEPSDAASNQTSSTLMSRAGNSTFLFQAQLFTTFYIQKTICNFGLKNFSV